MTTITIEVIKLLSDRHMTAKELILELGLEDCPDTLHGVITTLKKRKAVIQVGIATEKTTTGKPRLVSIYSYVEPPKPYKPRINCKKKRYYRVDLDKATTKDRYLTLLLKKNPQFLLYTNELGIKRGHYDKN